MPIFTPAELPSLKLNDTNPIPVFVVYVEQRGICFRNDQLWLRLHFFGVYAVHDMLHLVRRWLISCNIRRQLRYRKGSS